MTFINEVPNTNVSHMMLQQMEILIPTLTLKAPVEFAADLLHLKPLLGRFVFLFLHQNGTLPPQVPTTFVSASSFTSALINFATTLVEAISTPHEQCLSSEKVQSVRHAGRSFVRDSRVCILQILQKRVRQRCNCEWWGPPLDRHWSDKNRNPPFCGTLRHRKVSQVVSEMLCMEQETTNFELQIEKGNDELDECFDPCSRMEYTRPRVFADSMDHRHFRELQNEYRLLTFSKERRRLCLKESERSNACIGSTMLFRRLLAEVIKDDESPPTLNGTKEKIARRLKARDKKLSEIYELWLTISENDKRMLWWEAFPNSTKFKLNAPKDFNLVYQRLVLRPSTWTLEVDRYALVRTKWITLGQVGGAASFLAGLSVTVLVEVIDACFFVLKYRGREEETPRKRSAMEVANGTTGGLEMEELQNLCNATPNESPQHS